MSRSVLLAVVLVSTVLSGVAVAQSTDDGFDDARPIEAGQSVEETLGTNETQHVYSIALDAGESVRIFVYSTRYRGVRATVHGPSGRELDSTENPEAPIPVGVTADEAGTYSLEIERGGAAFDGETVDYTLSVEVHQPESESDDSIEDATAIAPGEAATGVVTGGDEDWYRVEADPGTRIVAAAVSPVPAWYENHAKIGVYDPNGVDIGESPDDQTVGECHTVYGCEPIADEAHVPESGVVYVRLSDDEIAGFLEYELSILATPPAESTTVSSTQTTATPTQTATPTTVASTPNTETPTVTTTPTPTASPETTDAATRAETATPEPTTSPTATPNTATTTVTVATTDSTRTSAETVDTGPSQPTTATAFVSSPTETSGDGPGFGVVVAIVALLSVSALATRVR